MEERWTAAQPLENLQAADLTRSGIVFSDGDDSFLYRTTGRHLANGGMGNAALLERRPRDDDRAVIETVVGKTFHADYLGQLRTDEVTRRNYERNLEIMGVIAEIKHPHLLPTYLSRVISDNHLTITPLKGDTLLELVARDKLSPRHRVQLLVQALRALNALHRAHLIHRDFTLRNVLASSDHEAAFLFDFDLAMDVRDVQDVTYREHYRGRIYGSPGYSVAPEILDPVLMESRISNRIDVYAAGGALFGLFTDALPYGDTDDMWSLLLRISDGVVFNGQSRVNYPDAVPAALRPIIDRCLERDPANRYGTIQLVIRDLEKALPQVSDRASVKAAFRQTLRYGRVDALARVQSVYNGRRDPSVALHTIEIVDAALSKFGYQLQRSLGRVKGQAIFMAAPVPALLAAGQFPDANTYPKIVTAVDLQTVDDPKRLVDLWLTRYLPILKSVRTGLLTALYRAVHDADSNFLFLFSEYVDDPLFGTNLDDHELGLEEVFGLGYLVGHQVGRLHELGLAHNNVGPASLLLKGLRDVRKVHPAMVGLVQPSFAKEALADDVRKLAGLISSWISPTKVELYDPVVRSQIDDLRGLLASVAFNESRDPPPITRLTGAMADGIALIDGNFSILRKHGGNLEAYALLLVEHPLYARLWGRA